MKISILKKKEGERRRKKDKGKERKWKKGRRMGLF